MLKKYSSLYIATYERYVNMFLSDHFEEGLGEDTLMADVYLRFARVMQTTYPFAAIPKPKAFTAVAKRLGFYIARKGRDKKTYLMNKKFV